MSKFNLFLSSDSPHIDQSTSELNIEIGFKRKEAKSSTKVTTMQSTNQTK